jgi:FixJ family two-component response regulator
MPGLTGLELQERLVAGGRRMSIVFVTGHVDVPKSVKAMKSGAVDLLTKPGHGEDAGGIGRRAGSPGRRSGRGRAEVQTRPALDLL